LLADKEKPVKQLVHMFGSFEPWHVKQLELQLEQVVPTKKELG
jgi:hypothetical protein